MKKKHKIRIRCQDRSFIQSVILVFALMGLYGCADLRTMIGSDATTLSGKWSGSYTCSQGLTGLTVVMRGSATGQVDALFEFYPLPQNPRVPSGKYNMKGSYSKGALALSGSSWIIQPGGFM